MLLEALRENFHLQVTELENDAFHGDHDLEECRTLLHLYGERNRRFRSVANNPYTLPTYLWPYILLIADRRLSIHATSVV